MQTAKVEKTEKPEKSANAPRPKAEPKPKQRTAAKTAEAKSASNRNTTASGTTSNLGGGLASLIMPKSMFDVFGTLPVEIMDEDSAPESKPVNDAEMKTTQAPVEITAQVVEEAKAITPAKSPDVQRSPVKSAHASPAKPDQGAKNNEVSA